MIGLPEDLSGKSVLDIGCNEGFFSFEAERRGASRVLGIDRSKRVHKRSEAVKRILSSEVEFRILDVYDLHERVTGTFDLVIFLSVFHHLRYPFLALDKIASITGELAIMEIPVAVPTTEYSDAEPMMRKFLRRYTRRGRPTTELSDDQPMMIRRIGKETGKLHLIPNVPFLTELLERAESSSLKLTKTKGYQGTEEDTLKRGFS